MSGDELWLYQGEEGALGVAHGPAFYTVRPGPPAISLEQMPPPGLILAASMRT